MVATLVSAFTGITSSAGKKTFWTTMAVIAVLIGIATLVVYQAAGSDYLSLGALLGFQVMKGSSESGAQDEAVSPLDFELE